MTSNTTNMDTIPRLEFCPCYLCPAEVQKRFHSETLSLIYGIPLVDNQTHCVPTPEQQQCQHRFSSLLFYYTTKTRHNTYFTNPLSRSTTSRHTNWRKTMIEVNHDGVACRWKWCGHHWVVVVKAVVGVARMLMVVTGSGGRWRPRREKWWSRKVNDDRKCWSLSRIFFSLQREDERNWERVFRVFNVSELMTEMKLISWGGVRILPWNPQPSSWRFQVNRWE